MFLEMPSRGGPARPPPIRLPAATRRGWVLAIAASLAVSCVAAPPAYRPTPAPAPSEAGVFRPADELERLVYLGRAQPDVAAPELLHYAGKLPRDDPRHLEALMEVGADYVSLSREDEVEQIAQCIESLADRVPLARPAAMLLRGQWLQMHGEVSKAERQFIEAAALFPADAPLYLRLRLLIATAAARSREGRYDDALIRYNEALRLVDDTGPAWRRVDLRNAIANVLTDAGQPDKAAELIAEQMRLAAATADEYGMSRAATEYAIRLSDGRDGPSTLEAWRSALDHARLAGNGRLIVIGLANMADYYLRHGDFKTAYDMSLRALPMARNINSESAQSVALGNAGLALVAMRRKEEGLVYLREASLLDQRTGSVRSLADSAYERAGYFERAGYLGDALEAYQRYRDMSDDLNQQDRQRSVIELQEGFANERRQHELDMLSREGRLKDEQLLHHDLERQQWAAAGVSSLLLLAVVVALGRRLRARNRQLSMSNEQLRRQAEVDPLTGLANRHHLQSVLARRAADGLEGTLYLIDVDHFKQINDRCGHAGGDTVLVDIARRLRAVLRDDDLVVRWGGEEFLVLVRPLPPAEADHLAGRLLGALAETPVTVGDDALGVSASIGYAGFPLAGADPDHPLAVGWERAIALADAAMYIAKAGGRNAACGVRRMRVSDAAGLESASRALDAAWKGGIAELHMSAGVPVQGMAR